jgi:hypothetical protein
MFWNKKSKGCQLCEKKVNHMLVTMDDNGHIHVHAPFDKPQLMLDFVTAIQEEIKVNEEKNNA